MNRRRLIRLISGLALLPALPAQPASAVALPTQPALAGELPEVLVHKDPNCGCCGAWVEHLRRADFPVRAVDVADLDLIKERLGVPATLAACHTAEVGRYVIEGHVPADEVARLLAERPAATGLAVPGMPIGSPGMEIAGLAPDRYEVILFGPAGRRVYARYHGSERLG